MYKAVISDLDGTLLDDKHYLTDKTIEVVQKFVKEGYKFYIATGRLYKGAKDIMDKLGIECDIVCINGARVTNFKGEELFIKNLEDSDNNYLRTIDYEKFGDEIFINGYIGDEWYVIGEKYTEYYSTERKDKPYKPHILTKEEFASKKYNKIFFVGNHENLLSLREEIEKNQTMLNVNFVSEKCLECYHKDCNKLESAKILLKRDNIKLEECISFGDGLNDYELITGTGKGYLMGNSIYLLEDKVKANNYNLEKIGRSETNSVAEKIEEIFNLK